VGFFKKNRPSGRFFFAYVVFQCFFSVIARWMLNHPFAKSNHRRGILLFSEQPISGIYYADLFAVMFDYSCLSVHDDQRQ